MLFILTAFHYSCFTFHIKFWMLRVKKSHFYGISAMFFQRCFMSETQVLMIGWGVQRKSQDGGGGTRMPYEKPCTIPYTIPYHTLHTLPISQILVKQKRFLRKSRNPGHGNLVLILQVEWDKNYDSIRINFLQILTYYSFSRSLCYDDTRP